MLFKAIGSVLSLTGRAGMRASALVAGTPCANKAPTPHYPEIRAIIAWACEPGAARWEPLLRWNSSRAHLAARLGRLVRCREKVPPERLLLRRRRPWLLPPA